MIDKSLKKKWYLKLKDSGFEDIEQENGMLKSWHDHYFQARYSEQIFYANFDYFLKAESYLNGENIQYSVNKNEYRIWFLHAKGGTVREIAKILKLKTHLVHSIIKKHKDKMLGNKK